MCVCVHDLKSYGVEAVYNVYKLPALEVVGNLFASLWVKLPAISLTGIVRKAYITPHPIGASCFIQQDVNRLLTPEGSLSIL